MRNDTKQRGSKAPIHASIKLRLGYPLDESDQEVLRDWKERLKRVCKPCWELKYCPYGPLVKQSPTLPTERVGSVEHNEYIKKVLKTEFIGQRFELDDERRALYQEWLADEEIMTSQAIYEIERDRREARIAKSDNPSKAFEELFWGDLPPIHEYRVDFDLNSEVDLDSLDAEGKSLLKEKIRERKRKLKKALRDGFEDDRRPLDEARRAVFSKQVAQFNAEDHPWIVPEILKTASAIFSDTFARFSLQLRPSQKPRTLDDADGISPMTKSSLITKFRSQRAAVLMSTTLGSPAISVIARSGTTWKFNISLKANNPIAHLPHKRVGSNSAVYSGFYTHLAQYSSP